MSAEDDARLQAVLSELRRRPPLSEQEFHYRIEPLHGVREAAIALLLDELDGDESIRDLAAATLHEIATAADAERLVEAFRDSARSQKARAEIAQVLAGVAGRRLERLLEPEELVRLSVLSIDTLLERLRDRAGLGQVVDLYRQSSLEERRALLDAIDAATQRPSAVVRLGAALDPLFPEERDKGMRALMIRRLAGRAEAASTRALVRWAALCHAQERLRIKEALRRLARLGIRANAREETLNAWITGADGTACYNVGISFPAALGLRDVLLACISLEAGLRAVSVIPGVEPEGVSEIRATVEQTQAIPVATIDPQSAFRHVHDARLRAVELGRPLPDGFEAAAAYLRRPMAAPPSRGAGAEDVALPRASLASLIDLPACGSWIFPSCEIPKEVTAELAGQMIGDSGRPWEPRSLRLMAERALATLARGDAPRRLISMLRHQAEVHRLRAEPDLAARARAAAREIEVGGITGSSVALRMMERSLRVPDGPAGRAPRPEVRDALKRRIEQDGRPRRRDVLVLHLAEALLRQAEDFNERLAPSERLTLEQMERLALGAAALAAREFTRDSTEQASLPGLERPLMAPPGRVRRRLLSSATRVALERGMRTSFEREIGLDPPRAAHLASAMVTVSRWFGDEVCLRRCRRDCLTDPERDGRELFYSPDHPAGLDWSPSAAPANASAQETSMWRQLSRRLDERIQQTTALLEALDPLGFAEGLEDRGRRRRIEDLLSRLRRARHELVRLREDPASIYSYVEEAQRLDLELSEHERPLVLSLLRRLRPAPEQFAGFRAYPAARGAWRRFERFLRRAGVHGIDLESLHAAVDRLEATAPLLALLRAAAHPRWAATRRAVAERIAEFSSHTPRTRLRSQTPYQDATGA